MELTAIELIGLISGISAVVGVGVFVGCTRSDIRHITNSLFDKDNESKITHIDDGLKALNKVVGNGLTKNMKNLGDKLDVTNDRLDILESRSNTRIN